MGNDRRDSASVALTFPVSCGHGRHDVLVEAAAWGRLTVVNPCDLLPTAARILSGSSCALSLPVKLRAIEDRLQNVWSSEVPPWTSNVLPTAVRRKLDSFVDYLRNQKELLAEQLLASADESESGAVSQLARDSDDDARCWATLVLAARHPQRARALLDDVSGWSPAMLIAGLCAHDWGQDPATVLLTEQLLQDDRMVPGVRARLATTLGEYGTDQRHAAQLVDLACSGGLVLQSAVLSGLGRLFERFRDQGPIGDPRLQRALTATLERAAATFARGEQRVVEWLTSWARRNWKLLTEALAAHQEPSIRIMAARLLEKVGDVRAAEALRRAACDANPAVSQAATSGLVVLGDALVHAGESAVPLLTSMLTGGPDRLTLFALGTLGTIGSPRAVDCVLRVLRKACTQNLKVPAIDTLGRIGDEPVVGPLLGCLNSSVRSIGIASANALASVVSRLPATDKSVAVLHRTLASGDPLVASSSLRKLSEIGSPSAVRWVVAALGTENEHLQVQTLVALRELDRRETLGPVLAMLVRAKDSAESEVTQQGVLTACSLIESLDCGLPADVATLVSVLDFPRVRVARAAARVLGRCSDSRVVKPLLIACLRGDVQLSQAAGTCLNRLARAEQLIWLTQILWHGDDRMARGAESAVVAVGGRAVKPLIKALGWPYPRARLAAARALGRIGDARAAAALQSAVKDTDSRVGETAAAALHAVQVSRGRSTQPSYAGAVRG